VNTGIAGDGGVGGRGAGGGGGGAVFASNSAHTGGGGNGGDGVAIITYQTAPANGVLGYALDMKPTGFGLITLGHHAVALHADPLTDQLYMVLDGIDEPAQAYLPLASGAPDVGVNRIFEFDSPNAYSDMVYSWKGKLNRLPRPGAFTYCQVKAADYANVLMNIYADGSLLFTQVLTDKEPFTLPMLDEYETCEIEFVGTSRVESYALVESIEELSDANDR
jgi:hypothetical protein